MHRKAFKMRVPLDCAEEYTRRHNEIWPDLLAELKAASIFDYTIYLDENTGDLLATMKITDPQKFSALAEKDIMKRWWALNKDIQAYEGERPFARDLKELFHME